MPASTSLPTRFSFAHDPATSCLRAHWAGPVAEAHLRTQYADLLAAASAHGNCCFWLLDLRQRNWSSPEFGRWFSDVFAPAAHAALHQSVFVACILSSAQRKPANTAAVHTSQRVCTAHGLYTFFFDDEANAREWLAHQQEHDKMS